MLSYDFEVLMLLCVANVGDVFQSGCLGRLLLCNGIEKCNFIV